MDWFIVPRMRPKPTTGVYSDWKPVIAVNCRHQCVYCTVPESEYGGIDNFHVEHFRPKSLFGTLENDIDNLFIACAICNRFKSDEWPGDPHVQGATATFLDPAIADYHSHIELSPDATLAGRTVAGVYVIERLYLNRPQLIVSRRYRKALRLIDSAVSTFNSTLNELSALGSDGHEIISEIAQASLRINQLQVQLAQATPYQANEIKRQKKKGAPKKPKTSKDKKLKKRD